MLSATFIYCNLSGYFWPRGQINGKTMHAKGKRMEKFIYECYHLSIPIHKPELARIDDERYS